MWLAGFLLCGVCTVLIGYVGCDKVFAVSLVILSTAFIGVSSAAVLGVNQLDLSPKYAGRHCFVSSHLYRLKANDTLASNQRPHAVDDLFVIESIQSFTRQCSIAFMARLKYLSLYIQIFKKSFSSEKISKIGLLYRIPVL